MLFSSLLVLAAAVSQAAGNPIASSGDTHCKNNINTPEYRAHIVSNYLNLWGGNLDLLNQTISPELEFQADSFPLSTNCNSGAGIRHGVIQTSAEFGAFVSGTRSGFEKYAFADDLWFGHDNNVVIRWSLRGIIGEHFTVLPTTLQSGDPVTYNGTEILILNKCTGLADKIYSAQDLITFFHNLGLKGVTV